jgi:demethylmenaquinone methyltransferase/2-methoxy-6-polyprenyl-1,4-benzoquinol methylase
MSEVQAYYSGVKSIFTRLAPFYDTIALPISRVRRQVVDLTAARNGSSVLDVATGTGAQAFAFAKQGYHVTGVDLSEAMIAVARRKNRYTNLKFEVGDATNLPFDDSSFDIACISFALHLMPLPIREQALSEMIRVVKSGGSILIADLALPEKGLSRFLVSHLFQLYDDRHYQEFLKVGLEGLLRPMGVEIVQQLSLLFGGVRIIKGAGLLKEGTGIPAEILRPQVKQPISLKKGADV